MSKVYNWLTQNSKLKKSSGPKTYNWGIPAYKSASGFITCPGAAACIQGCYARAGGYIFSNVAKVFEKRLAFSTSGEFVSGMDAEIKRRKVKRIRIHDSGDFYNAEYLNKWILIMQLNPLTEFYAYTKMVTLFRTYAKAGMIPDNFKVILSYGGKEDKLIDTVTERHSKVFETEEQLIAEGYVNATDDDYLATGDNHKVGLVYHGTKNFKNTDWSKVKGKESIK